MGWRPIVADEAGAFALDFAIEDPKTGLYGIGIECDAARHALLETARAREMWRPAVLRRSVPKVHRVSSYAWYHTPVEEKARLRAAISSTAWRGGMSGLRRLRKQHFVAASARHESIEPHLVEK